MLNGGSYIRGFSLVELSIVLVILGLLTGGILSGQSLIRASELRGVVSEFQTYQSAIMTFRDKYMSLPGDFRDATKFWGYASGVTGCVTNSGATANANGTCDGNGNGQVAGAAAANATGESFQFWRQLALAGLIEGTYTGTAASGANIGSVPRENVPASRLSQGAWNVGYQGAVSNTARYLVDYGNEVTFGAYVDASNRSIGKIMRPEEAWNIDTKIDDGRPAYGKTIARFWNNECSAPDSGTAAVDNLNASYRVSDTSLQCAFHFVRMF